MLFRARRPVRPVEQEWIDASLDELIDRFGFERLHGAVVEPTDEWFPGAYTGSRADVRSVFVRLCAHLEVDPDRVDLVHDDGFDAGDLPVHTSWHGAAGHHRVVDGRSVVGIDDDQARRPMALVATIAHELGHVLLHGPHPPSSGAFATSAEEPRRGDDEPLTDLLTVFHGLGIFSANAALDHGREVRGEHTYTSTSRLGYLTEPMYGYALARYAWLRGEHSPGWLRHLDTNPKSFFRRGMRHLLSRSSTVEG